MSAVAFHEKKSTGDISNSIQKTEENPKDQQIPLPSSSILHACASKRVEVFRAFFEKGIIDATGRLTQQYACRKLPPLPKEMISALRKKLYMLFSFKVQNHTVETSLQMLLKKMETNEGSLFLSKSCLVGECVYEYLFSEEFNYIQTLFKEWGISNLYDSYIKGKVFVKQTGIVFVRSHIEKKSSISMKKEDLDLLFFKMQSALSLLNISIDLLTDEFHVTNMYTQHTFFRLLSLPNSPFRWMWEGNLARPCISNRDDLSISLEKIFSNQENIVPITQAGYGIQGIFDYLLGSTRIFNPSEMEKGDYWLQWYEMQGATSVEEGVKQLLFEKNINSFFSPTDEGKIKTLLDNFVFWVSGKKISEHEKWALIFNYCCFLSRKFPTCIIQFPNLTFPTEENSFLSILEALSINKKLPFETLLAFLDIFSFFAQKAGSESIEIHHVEFKTTLMQISIEETFKLSWEPQLEKSFNHLVTLDISTFFPVIEDLMLLFNILLPHAHDLPTFVEEAFSLQSKLIESSTPLLQVLGLLYLSCSKQKETLSFLSFYPDLIFRLKGENIKHLLENQIAKSLGEKLPVYKNIQEKKFLESWCSFLLTKRKDPLYEEALCKILMDVSKEFNRDLFILKTPLIALDQPTLAKRFLQIAHPEKKSNKQNEYYSLVVDVTFALTNVKKKSCLNQELIHYLQELWTEIFDFQLNKIVKEEKFFKALNFILISFCEDRETQKAYAWLQRIEKQKNEFTPLLLESYSLSLEAELDSFFLTHKESLSFKQFKQVFKTLTTAFQMKALTNSKEFVYLFKLIEIKIAEQQDANNIKNLLRIFFLKLSQNGSALLDTTYLHTFFQVLQLENLENVLDGETRYHLEGIIYFFFIRNSLSEENFFLLAHLIAQRKLSLLTSEKEKAKWFEILHGMCIKRYSKAGPLLQYMLHLQWNEKTNLKAAIDKLGKPLLMYCNSMNLCNDETFIKCISSFHFDIQEKKEFAELFINSIVSEVKKTNEILSKEKCYALLARAKLLNQWCSYYKALLLPITYKLIKTLLNLEEIENAAIFLLDLPFKENENNNNESYQFPNIKEKNYISQSTHFYYQLHKNAAEKLLEKTEEAFKSNPKTAKNYLTLIVQLIENSPDAFVEDSEKIWVQIFKFQRPNALEMSAIWSMMHVLDVFEKTSRVNKQQFLSQIALFSIEFCKKIVFEILSLKDFEIVFHDESTKVKTLYFYKILFSEIEKWCLKDSSEICFALLLCEKFDAYKQLFKTISVYDYINEGEKLEDLKNQNRIYYRAKTPPLLTPEMYTEALNKGFLTIIDKNIANEVQTIEEIELTAINLFLRVDQFEKALIKLAKFLTFSHSQKTWKNCGTLLTNLIIFFPKVKKSHPNHLEVYFKCIEVLLFCLYTIEFKDINFEMHIRATLITIIPECEKDVLKLQLIRNTLHLFFKACDSQEDGKPWIEKVKNPWHFFKLLFEFIYDYEKDFLGSSTTKLFSLAQKYSTYLRKSDPDMSKDVLLYLLLGWQLEEIPKNNEEKKETILQNIENVLKSAANSLSQITAYSQAERYIKLINQLLAKLACYERSASLETATIYLIQLITHFKDPLQHKFKIHLLSEFLKVIQKIPSGEFRLRVCMFCKMHITIMIKEKLSSDTRNQLIELEKRLDKEHL